MSTTDSTPAPGLWRNGTFLILVSGQWVSTLGNTFYQLALYWFVLSVTHSRAALGVVGAISAMSGVFGLLSGTLVDRWDKKRTLIWSDVLRTVLSLTVAGLALAGHLTVPVLVAIVFVMSTIGTVFSPAALSLLPRIVSPEDLEGANGVHQGSGASAQLVGASLGGFLLGLLGPALLFLVNGLSFIVSVLSLGLMRVPPQTSRADSAAIERDGGPKEGAFRRFFAELKGGQRAIWENPFLRKMVPLAVVVNFAVMPLNILDVAWVRQVLHQGAFAYGLFGTAILVGIVFGSMLAGVLARKFPGTALIISGLLVDGLALILFSRIPVFVPDLALLFVFGLSVGIVNPVVIGLVQRATPPQLMGRVMGALVALVTMANPLGAALAGLLATSLPLATIFLGAGLLIALTSLLALGGVVSPRSGAPTSQSA